MTGRAACSRVGRVRDKGELRERMTDKSDDSRPEDGAPREVDPRLLEILVCPVTRGPLVYDREAQELISKKAKLAYPIRDGLPVMLPEEARELTEEEAG